MPSLAASVEKAVGVDDDDPGTLLTTYECIYAGKPQKVEDESANVDEDAEKLVEAFLGPMDDKENVNESVMKAGKTSGNKDNKTGDTKHVGIKDTGKQSSTFPETFLPPHVGRVKIHKDALNFEADMFGLDLTNLKLMRWQVKAVSCVSSRYTVTVTDWFGVNHDFQLHKLANELFKKCVKAWDLEIDVDALSESKKTASNPFVQDPLDPNSKLGREAAEALARQKAKVEARGKTMKGRILKVVIPYAKEGIRAYRAAAKSYTTVNNFLFPPPPPPPPNLPTVDVSEKTNLCLFVKIEKAEELLAMDSGGVSDPFATARWGSLECTTEIIYETVDPVWDETFVFNLGAVGEVIEENITLCLYDYDLALNDFLGFVRVDIKGKKVSNEKDWSADGKWYNVESLPEDYGQGDDGGGSTFDWGRVKDQLMFWEGKREYTGRVKIATWVGTRSDPIMRTAEHPKPFKVIEPSKEVAKFYVEPLTAALHVTVVSGKDILPMDGSKDDPGGLSDPYCEVVLEHEKTQKMETEQTHYIDDQSDPEWDRKFSFVISRPYTANTLWFKVYDYDGGFDQLIGQVKLKCEDLDIHEGLVKPPSAKWYTLLDLNGNDKNSEGDVYGEILLAAYIDEEYLEHMHLQKANDPLPNLGQLEVDIFRVWDLPENAQSDVFICLKYGPWWTRLPTKDQADGTEKEARYDLRNLFPALDLQVPVIIAAFAGEGDTPRLLGKIKVPIAALETNQRYFKVVDLGSVDSSSGLVVPGGKLDIALTYKRNTDNNDSTVDLVKQYLKPTCSDKWYLNPIPELEQEKVAKRHKELVIHQLVNANPPVRDSIAREMLDFGRHEFNSRMIQTSIARLQCVVAESMEIVNAIDDVFSWRNPYVTGFVQFFLFFMINSPRLVVPGVLFLIGAVPLAMFPSRRKRALAQISTDMDVSVGKLPPHLEILLNGDSLTNEQIKLLEKDKAKRESEEKAAEAARQKAEEEKAVAKKEEDELVAAILADVDAESEDESDDEVEAPKVAGSLNPFTNLMKQYEELTTMITSIQTAMDNVATVLEQILGVLSWKEPRVTFVVMVLLMLSSVGYFFSQFFVEFVLRVVRSVGGKAVVATKNSSRVGRAVDAAKDIYSFIWKTYFEVTYELVVAFVIDTTDSIQNAVGWVWSLFTLTLIFKVLRFVWSVYMLYALRHPSILPDETSQFKNASAKVEVDEKAESKRKEDKEASEKEKGEENTYENKSETSGKSVKKKTRAELEAEAERKRRREARAQKKEQRKKQKEVEEQEKKVKAAGASMIDRRPAAPLNAFSRIPSRGYQIL